MKALGMFARAAYRQLQVQARRNGHGHAPHNPGPPITWVDFCNHDLAL